SSSAASDVYKRQVLHGIDATPWAFSPWMVMQAANSEARKLLSAFAQHN
ncbi:hypothetical protein ACX3VG_06865, partial [Escherichia coli]